MRDYSVVTPAFWIGETGKKLRGHPEAQIVALYLMTSPHSTMTGVFHCPLMYMSYETGLSLEGASKGLQSLLEGGFCEYDHDSETVFVIRMARFQIGEKLNPKDNRAKGLIKEVARMPKTPMRSRFIEVYADVYGLDIDVEIPPKKTKKTEAPSKPLRSQEQEQDQDQEHLKDSCPELENNFETHEPEAIEEDVFILLQTNTQEQIPIFENQVLEYADLYPAVDCRQALRSMHGWLKANPKKCKTKRGMPAFVNGWLMREQDRGGNSVSPHNFNGENHGNSKTNVLSKLQQYGSELDEIDRQLGERIPPTGTAQDHPVCDDGIIHHDDNLQS